MNKGEMVPLYPPQLLQALKRYPHPERSLIRLDRLIETTAGQSVATQGGSTPPSPDWLDHPLCADRLPPILSYSPHLSGVMMRSPSLVSKVVLDPHLHQRRRRQEMYADLERLLEQPSTSDEMMAVLRRFKAGEALRIAAREILLGSPIDVTGPEISALATCCLEGALNWLWRRWPGDGRRPDGSTNSAPPPLCIMGLGKLGGDELNFSSDVDIMFIGAAEGTSRGDRLLDSCGGRQREHRPQTGQQETLVRLARELSRVVSEPTPDGYVFRVDLRLRPEGRAGPLVNSLDALEEYYESHGQAWERAVLLRSRPVSGCLDLGETFGEMMVPFVFPRHLDSRAIDEVAALAKEAAAQESGGGWGRVARHRGDPGLGNRNLKHGDGGIRQAELMIQSYQLLFGGRRPSLRVRNTIKALRAGMDERLIDDEKGGSLIEAYRYLRLLEHRVQMASDRQTHQLPESDDALQELALSVEGGPEDCPRQAVARLLDKLEQHRTLIGETFHKLFGEQPLPTTPPPSSPRGPSHGKAGTPDQAQSSGQGELAWRRIRNLLEEQTCALDLLPHLEELGFRDGRHCAQLFQILYQRPGTPFSRDGSRRFPELAGQLLGGILEAPQPESALLHVTALTQTLRGREGYYGLLSAQPQLARALTLLMGTSDHLATYLVRHPDVLDELTPQRHGAIPLLGLEGIREVLRETMDTIGEDPESFLAGLHRVKMEQTLRIGMADVWGALSAAQVQAELSALAECILELILWASHRHIARQWGFAPGPLPSSRPHAPTSDAERTAGGTCRPGGLNIHLRSPGEVLGMCILAMGSFGSREMGYGSDLDLVFIFDSRHFHTPGPPFAPTTATTIASRFYTRVAQRVLFSLQCPLGDGPLYHTDTELRPSGHQGTLVSSIGSFRHYHRTSAWPFERMALLHARAIAGGRALRRRLDGTIRRILAIPVDPPALTEQTRSIIHQLRQERRRSTERCSGRDPVRLQGRGWDVKRGEGGLMEAILAVDSLALCTAGERGGLFGQPTHVLIEAMVDGGVLPVELGRPAKRAYLFMRELELRLRMTSTRPSTAHLSLDMDTLDVIARRVGHLLHGEGGSILRSGVALENRLKEARQSIGQLVEYALKTAI